MHEKQKNHYVVSIDDSDGFPITRADYVGVELGFQVWYTNLRREWAKLRPGEPLTFPYYFHPVTEVK